MKMSVKELNTIIDECKEQVFQWKNKAFLELSLNDKNSELYGAFDSILNERARWWYNPLIGVLQPMTGEKLNDRPALANYGSNVNNNWVLVFNTNKGFLLR